MATVKVPDPRWWQGRIVGVDLETTAPQPEEARIVTAAIAFCGGGEETKTMTWLVNPGVEIPEGAAEIHGITTERACAEGDDAAAAIAEILTVLSDLTPEGSPLCIFNARYDLTVLDREARRHGLNPLGTGRRFYVVDPFVTDKQLDRYRRGSRKLDAMCSHYGATLDGAHDAAFDALAAARLAFRIGQRGEVIRRVRNAQEGGEKAALVREWEACRDDLPRLHAAQQRWALAERVRFAEYKRSIGEHDEAARIDAERGWPVLEIMAHEQAEAA